MGAYMGEPDIDRAESAAHQAVTSRVLLPEDIEAYRCIVRDGNPNGLPVDRLLAAGFIAPARQPGRFIALDPAIASHRILADERDALSEALERMAQLPDLVGQLSDAFDPHRFYGGPSSEFLGGKRAMNTRIGQVIDEAAVELFTAQPGPPEARDPEVVRLGVERSRNVLARGVEMRSLYPAGAQTTAHDYVDQIISAGGQVRVTASAYPRMVIVDGQHLFIENHLLDADADADEAHAGWHVVDRAVVMWARNLYLMLWAGAARWQDLGKDPAEQTITTSRQRRILRELAGGCDQQQIAGRVGLSPRVVAKELAAVREALGYSSLYQVMVWWGTSPESDIP